MAIEDVLQFYSSLGIHLESRNSQGVGDCPFCLKEQHFFVNLQPTVRNGRKISEGVWQCKVCGEGSSVGGGNYYTLIQKIYEYAPKLTDFQLASISENRKIPAEIIADESPFFWNDEWYFPVHNNKSAIVNLLKINDDFRLYGLRGMGSQLFGIHRYTSDVKRPVWICEGQWDYMALRWVFKSLKRNDDLLAMPGTAFQEQWLGLFAGRDVRILTDADQPRKIQRGNAEVEICPGRDARDRIIKLMASMGKPPKHVSYLNWPSDLSDGYDIRDLVADLMPIQSIKSNPSKSLKPKSNTLSSLKPKSNPTNSLKPKSNTTNSPKPKSSKSNSNGSTQPKSLKPVLKPKAKS